MKRGTLDAWRSAMAAGIAALVGANGCNSVIGASEPEVLSAEDNDHDVPGAALCGNGAIDPGEACDDGNGVGDDGCTACAVDCGEAPEVRAPNGHCYRPEDDKAWDDAQAACEAWGGYLATVTSPVELALIQDIVRHTTWIGADRADAAAEFAWVTGEPWGFTSWSPNQPAAEGDCVAIDGDLLGFAVFDCAAPQKLVCERGPLD